MNTKVPYFRTPASVAEQLVHTGPCLLHRVIPDILTTGTITLRDGRAADGTGVVVSLQSAGIPKGVWLDFGGAWFPNGLTIQLSVATDLCAVVWEPVQ